MKKVLFVATVVKMHIEVFHLPYLKWFKENGYEVHVCAKNDYENKKDCNIPYCDKFVDLPFERSPFKINNIKVYKQLKKVIETNNYDIIHCHTPMGGVLTRLAGKNVRKNKTKLIYTAHGFHFYRGGPLRNWLLYYPVEKLLSQYTDVLITINKEDFNYAKSFKPLKLSYVPGVGVDVKKFNNSNDVDRDKKRRELGVKSNEVALLSVGELSKRKNHEVVIRALAELDDPNIIYLVCGQGDLDEYLENLAGKLRVNIRFLGFRKDIYEICAASDIFLFPSYQEGLPVALMEAMSAGLPVVCSQIRGNTDLIENGTGGFLVHPGDISGFKENIEILANDNPLRKKMGLNNKKSVKKYDKEVVERSMESIYRELLK